MISFQDKDELPSPPTVYEEISFEDFKEMFKLIGINDPIHKEIETFYQDLFPENEGDIDPTIIAELFPSGQKMCFCPFPFEASGLPVPSQTAASGEFLKRLQIMEDGLTIGLTSTPGYYFGYLPLEIKENCVFEVPVYEHMTMPNPDEIRSLKKVVLNKIEILKEMFRTK